MDLLDRILIIRTLPYTLDDIKSIIQIRAKTEGITLSEDSLNHLAESGVKTSLRYLLYYLTYALFNILHHLIPFFFFFLHIDTLSNCLRPRVFLRELMGEIVLHWKMLKKLMTYFMMLNHPPKFLLNIRVSSTYKFLFSHYNK